MDAHRHSVILLTGQPGIGKTTVIRQIAERLGDRAGGFYTQEMRANGVRRGFEIITLDGASDYLALRSNRPIFSREIPFKSYRVNLVGIEDLAVAALRKARDRDKLIIVDEIGPMEITSPLFCRVIRELLEDESTCLIGTIVRRPYRFADEVKRHPRVKVQEITVANRNPIAQTILDRLEETNCYSSGGDR
ncbi:MAG: nucleoside-triphosphatase [bacterium]